MVPIHRVYYIIEVFGTQDANIYIKVGNKYMVNKCKIRNFGC